MYIVSRIAAFLCLISLRKYGSHEMILLCYFALGMTHAYWGFHYGWSKFSSDRSRELRFITPIILAFVVSLALTLFTKAWGIYVFALHHVFAEVYYGPERSNQSQILAGFRGLGHLALYVAITAPAWPFPIEATLSVAALSFIIAWGTQWKSPRFWSMGDDFLTASVFCFFISKNIFAHEIDPVFLHIIHWTFFLTPRSPRKVWYQQGFTYAGLWIPFYLLYVFGYMGQNVYNSRAWLAVIIVNTFVGYIHIFTTPFLTLSQPLWVNRILHPKRFG